MGNLGVVRICQEARALLREQLSPNHQQVMQKLDTLNEKIDALSPRRVETASPNQMSYIVQQSFNNNS